MFWFNGEKGFVGLLAAVAIFISIAVVMSGVYFRIYLDRAIKSAIEAENGIFIADIDSGPVSGSPVGSGSPSVGTPSVSSYLKTYLERLTGMDMETASPPAEPNRNEDLTTSSFSDLFSGTGRLDLSRTNFYQDKTVTAFIFFPLIEMKKTGLPPAASNAAEYRRNGEYCLAERCLRAENSTLFFKNSSDSEFKKLDLPPSVSEAEIRNVSVGRLDTFWLVGVTTATAGGYEGRVFSFDSREFREIFGGEKENPFHSRYEGIFGFGGGDDDWLAVYGAYEGLAARVKKGGSFEDISRFFGIRAMVGGFRPAVIRTDTAQGRDWYVFSLDEKTPVKLIKLFQNKTGEIRGAADLSRLVSLFGNPQSAVFYPVPAGQNPGGNAVLLAELRFSGGGKEFWEFIDGGFDKSRKAEIVSANLNNYSAEIRSAWISDWDLSLDGAAASFFLSNDGLNWHKADMGQEIVFGRPGRRLMWRAEFYPDADPATSVFFDKISIGYKVKFD